jgi:hypothetical protein
VKRGATVPNNLNGFNGSIVSSRPAVNAIPPTDWTLAVRSMGRRNI